jgi:hypothetical protein
VPHAFGIYNEFHAGYNACMATDAHVMTISRNGQVSLPAAARARWKTRHVLVADLGDEVVMRPLPADPIAALRGKYAGRGPSSEQVREQARQEDVEREESR